MYSIIIVNYNGKHFLSPCVESIRNNCTGDYEIVIVDNASSDGSVDYINSCLPDVRLVVSQVNTGFTGGNNIGASAARGDVLVLLNNDTVVLTDLAPLAESVKTHGTGVSTGKIYYGDMRTQPSIGYEHSPARIFLSWAGLSKFTRLPSIFRRLETADSYYEKKHVNVCWVSGALLCTPTDVWKSLGGLDEDFFMYVEDVDYCRRVRNLGLSINYDPGVKIIHYEGAGKQWIGAAALKRTVRSYLLYTRKHYPSLYIQMMAIALGWLMIGRSKYYRLRWASGGKEIFKEKADGYYGAGDYLIHHSSKDWSLPKI